MNDTNIGNELELNKSEIRSENLLRPCGPDAAAQDSSEFDSRCWSWCRCCLKVNRRSEMLNDEFCDTACWSEFQRSGNGIVANSIDRNTSICCTCSKKVLVMIDGLFSRIPAYQCVNCRTRPDAGGYGPDLCEQRWVHAWLNPSQGDDSGRNA